MVGQIVELVTYWAVTIEWVSVKNNMVKTEKSLVTKYIQCPIGKKNKLK